MVDDKNEVTIALRQLLTDGKIILTPREDYDDSYVINYAMSRGGIAVSNDRWVDILLFEKENRRGKEFCSLLTRIGGLTV